MGGLHMYFSGTSHEQQGQEDIRRSGNQGLCCSTNTLRVLFFGIVADNQCFKMGIVAFFLPSSSSILPHVNSSKQFISRA